MTTADADIDVDQLTSWVREVHDPSVSDVRIRRLDGGNSSGAWRLDLTASGGDPPLVLKVSNDEGIVFDGGARARPRSSAPRHGPVHRCPP